MKHEWVSRWRNAAGRAYPDSAATLLEMAAQPEQRPVIRTLLCSATTSFAVVRDDIGDPIGKSDSLHVTTITAGGRRVSFTIAPGAVVNAFDGATLFVTLPDSSRTVRRAESGSMVPSVRIATYKVGDGKP
jgi:hypothetical protein